MALRRLNATVTVSIHTRFESGNVYRQKTLTLDLTKDIYALPLATVRSLKDDCAILLKLAQSSLPAREQVTSVVVCEAIRCSLGINRMTDVTLEDLRYARHLAGVARYRPLRPPMKESKRAHQTDPGR